MSKRLLLIFCLLLLPAFASADDTVPASDATPAPAAAASPAATPEAGSAAGLGPQTSSPGSSTATSGTLQPAGLAPIQSAPSSAAALGAPSDVLQAPTTPDANLQVLSGEADGAPHNVADQDGAPSWPWAVAAIALALLIFGGIILRDRRRFGRA